MTVPGGLEARSAIIVPMTVADPDERRDLAEPLDLVGRHVPEAGVQSIAR